MTILTEWETKISFDFDAEALAEQVIIAACEAEGCPYEIQVNLTFTDNVCTGGSTPPRMCCPFRCKT